MIELIPTVATSFATAMTTNAFKNAKGPAQALDDIMSLVGFEKLHFYAEKKRVENEVFIKDYKEKIAQELVKIPEENIQEPPLAIAGPALEASRFYIEEESLRQMFANLIASSMNNEKNINIHPSFVEIIKQLSTLDAKILVSFKNSATHLIGKMILDNPNGYFTIADYFYLHETIEEYHLLEISKSISNLMRLGLIQITDDTTFQEKDFFENKIVIKFIDSISHDDGSKLRIKYARLDTTPYGDSFILSCVYSPS